MHNHVRSNDNPESGTLAPFCLKRDDLHIVYYQNPQLLKLFSRRRSHDPKIKMYPTAAKRADYATNRVACGQYKPVIIPIEVVFFSRAPHLTLRGAIITHSCAFRSDDMLSSTVLLRSPY